MAIVSSYFLLDRLVKYMLCAGKYCILDLGDDCHEHGKSVQVFPYLRLAPALDANIMASIWEQLSHSPAMQSQ